MKYIVQNSSSTYQTVIEEVINQNKDKYLTSSTWRGRFTF